MCIKGILEGWTYMDVVRMVDMAHGLAVDSERDYVSPLIMDGSQSLARQNNVLRASVEFFGF